MILTIFGQNHATITAPRPCIPNPTSYSMLTTSHPTLVQKHALIKTGPRVVGMRQDDCFWNKRTLDGFSWWMSIYIFVMACVNWALGSNSCLKNNTDETCFIYHVNIMWNKHLFVCLFCLTCRSMQTHPLVLHYHLIAQMYSFWTVCSIKIIFILRMCNIGQLSCIIALIHNNVLSCFNVVFWFRFVFVFVMTFRRGCWHCKHHPIASEPSI